MAAQTQTQGEFLTDAYDRLNESISRAEFNRVVKAIIEQAQEDLESGVAVPLLGLVKLTPTAKAGRTKGTVVRNPFDGSERKLTANEPDKIRVKAQALSKAKPDKWLSPAKIKSLVSQLS